MIEKIQENLYRIEIPLPRLHHVALTTLNSYVITASEGNLIIDTGMDAEPCAMAMRSCLNELGVDLRRTDFFITHFHVDHLGLVESLAMNTSEIYLSKLDVEKVRSVPGRDDIINRGFAYAVGFPENELPRVTASHPGLLYRSNAQVTFTIPGDGDTIKAGHYTFVYVETPGHTKGHMCLYEPGKKLLIAGDHLLSDISTTIQLWCVDENPLQEYLASLEKVYGLDVDLVLPGHGDPFINCKERIGQLRHHHKRRVADLISIFGTVSKTPYQVASQTIWDMLCDSWHRFPAFQKWLATGEVMAHLKYLEGKGVVRMERSEQNIAFSMRPNHSL